VPVFWDDNYISLLPGEERSISATFDSSDLNGKEPALEVAGYNVAPETVKISH